MAEATNMNTTEAFRDLIAHVRETHESYGMDLRIQFASVVAQALKNREWTQAELARRIDGMAESSISEIMHADANCTLETIGKILFALGIRGKLMEASVTTAADTSGEQVEYATTTGFETIRLHKLGGTRSRATYGKEESTAKHSKTVFKQAVRVKEERGVGKGATQPGFAQRPISGMVRYGSTLQTG